MKYLLSAITLVASNTFAGTIIVPAEAPSIQAAIEKSLDGDTILVSPGTYLESVNLRGKAITVESVKGRASTIIDAQGLGTGVAFITGETNKTVLKGFTITGGIGMSYNDGRYGGGVFLLNSSPTIKDCAVINNTAEWGGGIHNLNSSPRLINCLIDGNEATINGGGMRCHEYSEPYLDSCTFTNNIGTFGGAMDYALDSIPTIVNCEIIGNGATFLGGAIFVGCDCSAPNIADTTICWNIPDHIVGGWNNNGGNTMCDVCEADVNRDGVVGINDLLEVVGAWGPGACLQDITGEGGVDVQDLLIVIESWGNCE